MSERSEGVVVTAPKAHRCTIGSNPIATAYETMVHQCAVGSIDDDRG